MTPFQTRRHPFVRQCRRLAVGREDTPGDVLLDGLHLLQEALAAGLEGMTVGVGQDARSRPDVAEALRRAQAAGGTVLDLSQDALEAASPVRSPSGVVAIARFQSGSLESALDRGPALIVTAVDVQDPGNVGAIIRAAGAAGATGVVIAGRSADPLGWRAIRGSMGSVFRMPLAIAGAADAVIGAARDRGIATMAAAPGIGTDVFAADLTRPIMLLVGGEGGGLAPDTLAACDERIRIPMDSQVESLNVAVAAGVMLFEARRQRNRRGPA